MKVYFYHTQDIQYIRQRMQAGEFPSHFLYGATRFCGHGIDVVWHQARLGLPRWRMMLRNTWRIVTCKEHVDAVFATHYRGIELLVFMRALHLYRKPIVVWHHQPVVRSKAIWREWLGRLFYRGMDELFFFSQKLIDDSTKTGKVPTEKMHLGHWGADIDFYDRILNDTDVQARRGFVSTGKERRDMPTLIKAFNAEGADIDIYLNAKNGELDYKRLLRQLECRPNVKVHIIEGLIPYELSKIVSRAACVAICCQETKYTVGLTTLVEALALGLPVLASRNPQFPIDIDAEGCGITIPYYNIEGWQRAIDYITTHPEEAREMGRRGRKLAERLYNDEQCAAEIAEVLRKVIGKR